MKPQDFRPSYPRIVLQWAADAMSGTSLEDERKMLGEKPGVTEAMVALRADPSRADLAARFVALFMAAALSRLGISLSTSSLPDEVRALLPFAEVHLS